VSARQKLAGLAVANSKVFNAVNRIPIKLPKGQNTKGKTQRAKHKGQNTKEYLALLVFLTIALAMLKKTASQYTPLCFVH